MDKITLVVVDDHPLFRQGVVDTLSLEADMQVLAQADNGEAGLALIHQLKPQAAVVDVNLPGMNGQQVTKQLSAEKFPTRVVLLTAYDDSQQKIYAMRAGAAAFCTKDIQPEKLVWVIRSVCSGGYVFSGKVMNSKELGIYLAASADGMSELSSSWSKTGVEETGQTLSNREMQVLVELTRGLSNKEIAANLGISHQTVKNHVTAILRKLGVDDRTQAAVYALRQGWVRLHQQNFTTEE